MAVAVVLHTSFHAPNLSPNGQVDANPFRLIRIYSRLTLMELSLHRDGHSSSRFKLKLYYM